MHYQWTNTNMQSHLLKYNITAFLGEVHLQPDGKKMLSPSRNFKV